MFKLHLPEYSWGWTSFCESKATPFQYSSAIQQTLIEHRLCTRHSSRNFGYISELNEEPCLHGGYMVGNGGDERKTATTKNK